MKIIYKNKAMNKQKDPSPKVKTLILMSCLLILTVGIRIFYNPTDPKEAQSAMAEITDTTKATEQNEA